MPGGVPRAELLRAGGRHLSSYHRRMAVWLDIETDDGVLRGRRGQRIARWRSVPYAAPPLGDLRFRGPEPVVPWRGVRLATEFAHAAIQPRFGTRLGLWRYQPMSEDALTLNIVAPAAASPHPRPVLVFIHGGANLIGSSALGLYSGSRLALVGDVIVVSLNYRLGAFGYLDLSEFGTADRPVQSNLGLRDQLAALQWVHRNIAAFGGDPNNVTIFGESAGAHAVLALLATPAAEGLFHQAIAQSAPADWGVDITHARQFAGDFIKFLGARPGEELSAITTADTHDIYRAYVKTILQWTERRPQIFPAVPVVDGDFLPQTPVEAIVAGRAHRVPLIIGTCRTEGALFTRAGAAAGAVPVTEESMRRMFADNPQALTHIRNAYPGYPRGRTAVQAGGDYMFWRPSLQVMAGHSRYAPTWAYRYDFAPRGVRWVGMGATHATDLFPTFGFGNKPLGRAMTLPGGRMGLQAVTEQIQRNWVNFAKNAKPVDEWPQYTELDRKTLVIDYPSRIIADPDRHRRLAWEAIFPSETPADKA